MTKTRYWAKDKYPDSAASYSGVVMRDNEEIMWSLTVEQAQKMAELLKEAYIRGAMEND